MKNPKSIFCLLFFLGLFACNDPTTDTPTVDKADNPESVAYNTDSPESMLLAVQQACGGIDKLKSLIDVEYDYHYVAPDGKKEISKERYIFDNEISWARYTTHEINVSPDLEGDVIQFYDGSSATVYNNSIVLEDPQVIGTGQFLRQANYMWFNMMFKLTDPGVISSYEGQKEIEGKSYDAVKVTYDPGVTGKEENDIFVLYINPENRMVESFDFSLPAWNIQQPVLNAKLTYEEIDGIHVITNRAMSAPNPEGEGMVPIVNQSLKNVKFNNGFTAEQLSKDI